MENEMIMLEEGNITAVLTSRKTTFCSFKAATDEEQVELFNMITAPDKRLAEMINLVIPVKDIFAEEVQCRKEDGTFDIAPRIVVITDDGKSYQAVSQGVLNAFTMLITSFGPPTWDDPICIQPYQISKTAGGQTRNILSFKVLGRKSKMPKPGK